METNKILQGNTLELLKTLPDESINLILYSPPYYNLRCYDGAETIWDGKPDCNHEWGETTVREINLQAGNPEFQREWREKATGNTNSAFCKLCNAWKGQFGSEPTVEEYVEHSLQISAELKRVLCKTGSLWINISDTYVGGGGKATEQSFVRKAGETTESHPDYPPKAKLRGKMGKSLMGVPWRVAIAMMDKQEWRLRNDCLWIKGNPMPSSATDRFTRTYEDFFFFVKEKDYYFKQQFDKREYPNEKVKEIYKEIEKRTKLKRHGNLLEVQEVPTNQSRMIENTEQALSGKTDYAGKQSTKEGIQGHKLQEYLATFRYTAREVIKEHPELTKEEKEFLQYISQNSPGNPEGRNMRDIFNINTSSSNVDHYASYPEKLLEIPIDACSPPDGIVLDPFAGSGTTLVVAQRMGRKWLGMEISSKYVEIARKRLAGKLETYAKEPDIRNTVDKLPYDGKEGENANKNL